MRGTCAAAIELAAEDHLEFILESWFGPGTGSSDRVAAWRALGAFRRFFSGLLYESLYAEVRRLLQDDDFVREAAPHLIGG